MPRLGPYSKEIKLAKPRHAHPQRPPVEQIRAKLTRQVGGAPGWGQQALIEGLPGFSCVAPPSISASSTAISPRTDSAVYLAWAADAGPAVGPAPDVALPRPASRRLLGRDPCPPARDRGMDRSQRRQRDG